MGVHILSDTGKAVTTAALSVVEKYLAHRFLARLLHSDTVRRSSPLVLHVWLSRCVCLRFVCRYRCYSTVIPVLGDRWVNSLTNPGLYVCNVISCLGFDTL